MFRTIAGFFWIALYLLVVLVPVFLMLAPPTPSGRPFFVELSIALGFVGLGQVAVQFVLIARFKSITGPYGIDVILQYHRQIALLAILVILAHPLVLLIEHPARVKLLNPLGGNWASRCAWASVAALTAIAVTSLLRRRLRLSYEAWRASHLTLGIVAILFAQLHVSLAGLYTNTVWKQTIWIVIALAMVGMVFYLRLLKPLRQRRWKWRVAEVRPELGKTWVLALEPVDHPGMAFHPGQFAWLKLARSPFTFEEHPFSFSSSAARADRVEFGIKELGDFTRRIKDTPVGACAFLDGPHGAFSVDWYPATGYVLIAGGVGITPFMSFLHTMADRADPRPIALIYAAKDWDDLAYRDELDALRGRLDLEVVYVLQQPPEGWTGERGVVTRELIERRLPREEFTRMYFVCGPPPMMTAVEEALVEHGIREESIQLERFDLV